MIDDLLIILWSVAISISSGAYFVAVGFVVIVPRVSDAIDRTRTECDQLITERDAFKEFTKRVAALPPDDHTSRAEYKSNPPATGTGLTTVVNPVGQTSMSTGDIELASTSNVRDTYRETVMAVSHYEEEYSESLDENLTAELGPELAQTLQAGDVLTPQLQAAVLSQARQASKQRSDLLSHVESEYDSLVEARRQLRDLYETTMEIEDDLYPRPVRELVQSWKRLETAKNDCETLLRERQNRLQMKHGLGAMSKWPLQEYLYIPFQWRHPILYDGLEMLTRIRRAKQETVKAIYNW